ncbi:lipase family protein [Labedaea rhizosphaerae]|uniref:Secretory lipase n=1 Tax=Labedaea rhizosphaerae TaxID=598644 RepID=A0A4R6SEZ4_LABRH|nr:lipase family protein [Labedaea rhizosphaerae]TDQ00175.1 secretory lipase [Labedaea rhizosphaerae]
MRRLVGVLVAVGLALGVVSAGPASAAIDSSGSAVILPPDQDPFYVPPADYGSRPNGTVLRSREITALAYVMPIPVHAYQVLYKSVDGHGAPVAEAATVLVPYTSWTGPGTRPLVSYQIADDSLSTRCQPSYTLRVGIGSPTGVGSYEVSMSYQALLRGYAIVYADYEGPHSQFAAGPQAAHGVLDGMRAVLHHAPAGLDPNTKITLWGYSGGGLATTWAAEQQGSYAPELNVVGAAAGGVPAELGAMLRHNNGNLGAGLALLGVIGLARAYPESGVYGILNDRGRALFATNEDACTLDVAVLHPFDRIENYTTIADPIDSPQARFLIDTNNPGQATPRMPYYNYEALQDEFVPAALADGLLKDYCADGGTVKKVRIPFSGHITGEVQGGPGALQFLADRVAGKPVTSDC